MRWLRLAAIALAGLVVVLTGAIALALHRLDTNEDTQRWLGRTLSGMLSTPDGGVRIGRVGGNLVSRLHLHDVALTDRDGAWATLDRLEVAWSPADLLRGRLLVHAIDAGTVTVERAPAPTTSTSTGSSGVSLPIGVSIERFAVGAVALEAPLLGEPARLGLTGAAHVKAGLRDVVLDLAGHRTDGLAGGFTVKLRPPDGEGFALDVDYDEPAGGIAARLLQLPGLPAVSLRLDGSGPATDWRGHLVARAESLARLDMAVTLDASTRVALGLDGSADIGGLLPPELQPALARIGRLALRAEQARDGTITLSDLTVEAPVGRLTASGRVAPTLDVTTTLAVTDAALLSRVAGMTLEGGVTATAHAAGDPAAPRVAAQLTSDRLVGGDQTISGLTIAIKGTAGGAEITGSIARLEAAGAPPVETIDWTIVAAQHGQTIDVTRLDITSPLLTVRGRAAMELDARRLAAELTVSADELGLWRGLTGLALAGRTRAELALRGSLDGGIDLDMTVHASDLATGIPAADALLGGKLDGSVRARRGADGMIALRSIVLDAADLTVRGQGEMIDGDARSELTITVPRLAPLGRALGTPLQGTAKTVVQIERTGTATTGRIAADATLNGTPVRLATRLALDDQRLALDDLRLDAAGATITGSARTALATQLTDGTLTLAVPDLAALAKLAGAPLAGRAHGRVKLSGERGAQRVELNLEASGLKSGDIAISKLVVAGTVADALRAPKPRITATVTDLRSGATTLARTEFKAEGALDQLTWSLALQGKAGQAVSLDVGGQLARTGDAERVTLQRLAGRYGDVPIRLEQPVTLEHKGDSVSVGSMRIGLGKGRLRLAASRRAGQLAGELEIADLPISLVRLAAPTLAIDGTLGGRARLAGTAAAPEADVTLALRRVALAGNGAPPIDADITARWRGGSAEATARFTGLADRPLAIVARVPVAYQPDPFGIALVPDGPINVRIDGAIDLQRALLLAGIDHPATGRAVLALEIGGTTKRPQVSGSAELVNGRFVDSAAGVTVQAITAKLVGSGTRLDLVALSMSDSRGGTINGKGGVDLAAADPTFEGTATLANFTVQRNDLSAWADGTLRFGGGAKGAQIAGEVTLRKAEIHVPDRMPVTLVNVEVTEINLPGAPAGAPPPRAKQPPATEAAIPIKLELAIHLPGQVLVRGRGLDAEARGDLTVRGTAAKPDIQGTLTIVRGRFDFLGKMLDLAGGKLNFVGGELEPFIDIQAVSKSSDFTATIQLTGKASKPTLTLTSDPPLPQDEILARMLFGKRVDQLSAAQALQLAHSVAQLTGGSGGGLVDRIRKTTGLDVIDIKSSEEQKGAFGGSTLSVGKYIGNRTMITAEQGATANSSRAGVEIGITDELSVKTDVGASADSRLGLQWKRDY